MCTLSEKFSGEEQRMPVLLEKEPPPQHEEDLQEKSECRSYLKIKIFDYFIDRYQAHLDFDKIPFKGQTVLSFLRDNHLKIEPNDQTELLKTLQQHFKPITAAITIQAFGRGFLARRKVFKIRKQQQRFNLLKIFSELFSFNRTKVVSENPERRVERKTDKTLEKWVKKRNG